MNPLTLSLIFVIAATAETFAAGKVLPAAASRSAAGRVPTFDIQSICSRSRVSDGFETAAGCTADEQSAREQLNKGWTKYASAERLRCTELSSEDGLTSYVELLTCLEVAEDAKKLSNE
jgi:hypothetical protein